MLGIVDQRELIYLRPAVAVLIGLSRAADQRLHASRFSDDYFAGAQPFIQGDELRRVVGAGGNDGENGEIAGDDGRQDLVVVRPRNLAGLRAPSREQKYNGDQSTTNRILSPGQRLVCHGVSSVWERRRAGDVHLLLTSEERRLRVNLHVKSDSIQPSRSA